MDEDNLLIKKRNLPHWTKSNSIYFITFNLFSGELSCDERTIVYKHIIAGNNKFYTLHILTVMPDHIHMIADPIKLYTLGRIMKGTKGVSAHLINKHRGTNGSIWQQESFDRIIRDKKEYDEKMVYIYNNAIKKSLVDNPEEYEWLYVNRELPW
jgi:REP element-mobilizing transposase RayT